MSEIAAYLTVVAGAAGIVVVLFRYFRRERARTQAMMALAPQLGFSMANGKGKLQIAKFGFGTPLFAKGSGSRTAYNAMAGTAARLEAMLFDYPYNAGAESENGATIWQTVAVFANSLCDLPQFELKARPRFALARKMVAVAGNSEFSKRFALVGKDQAKLKRLFGPGLTGFLVSANVDKKWLVEGAGQWLVLYQDGRRLPPGEWRAFLEESSQIATRFFELADSEASGSRQRSLAS